jgi:hypothetical protein
MLTGPDQSHFGQEITPVAIVRKSNRSRLMTCPHRGQTWTLSHGSDGLEVDCGFMTDLLNSFSDICHAMPPRNSLRGWPPSLRVHLASSVSFAPRDTSLSQSHLFPPSASPPYGRQPSITWRQPRFASAPRSPCPRQQYRKRPGSCEQSVPAARVGRGATINHWLRTRLLYKTRCYVISETVLRRFVHETNRPNPRCFNGVPRRLLTLQQYKHRRGL